MTSITGLVLIVVFFMVNYAEGKIELPSGMSQHQYCHGCLSTMKELEKMVASTEKKSGSREVAVMESMEKICTPPNFLNYDYSPPKTVKACKVLLERNEEHIESALVKGTTNAVALICNELSGACDGVDLTNDKEKKFSDIDLTGDKGSSKSVNIDPSGKVVLEDEKKKKPAREGKTLSKSNKKKKQKKKKSKKGDTGKDTKETKKVETKPGQKKGALHNLNIDINDPSSLERVMAQINELTNKYKAGDEKKDEL